MKNTTIAIFLSIMFATLTLAPHIIVLIDCDYDISLLMDASEEEERKGEEKVKDFEIEIPLHFLLEYTSKDNQGLKSCGLQINNYSSIFKELTSPPPELNI